MEKVEIEVGLACLAHNLRKKAYKDAQTTEKEENNSNKHSKNRKSTNLGVHQLNSIENYAMAA